MLVELDPKWARNAHKAYPELLRGTISKEFKAARARATKNGDSQLISMLENGIRSASALARITEVANGARIVADYEPNEAVNFTSARRFSLKSVEITEAHNWQDRVYTLSSGISDAWKQINV